MTPAERAAYEAGRRAFDAYNAQGPNPGKTFDGREVPPFEKVGPQVQAKWIAAARALLTPLAKGDPVFETRSPRAAPPPPPARQLDAVRRCKLCGAQSGHNEENVRHAAGCPWIEALLVTRPTANEIEAALQAVAVAPAT